MKNVPFPDPKYVTRNEQDMLVALCRYGQSAVVRDYVKRGLSEDLGSMSRVTLVNVLIRGGELKAAVDSIETLPNETAVEYGHVFALILIQHGYPESAIPLLEIARMPGLSERERNEIRKDALSGLSAFHDRPDIRAWLERQPDYAPKGTDRNPDPRTLRFAPDDVRRTKEAFATADAKEHGAFRTKLKSALWTGGVPDDLRERTEQAVTRSMERWTPEERSIGIRVIDGTGVLSPEFSRLLAFMEGRRSECVVEVHKTGSALFIHGRRNPETRMREFTFVNDISATAANAWEQARDAGIPVAPILRPPVERANGSTRVYSRYCGKPIFSYLDLTQLPHSFRKWIETEVRKTKDDLLRRGIRHGHPHSGNFTIEFYRSETVDRETAAGKTVNDIPFSQKDVTFDPIPYLEHPEEWVPVVRLIDWDQATSSRS